MKPAELLKRLADGQVANVRFADAQRLVEALGFELDRVRGSHHIYRHPEGGPRLNLQARGGQAKPYQLRQSWSSATPFASRRTSDRLPHQRVLERRG